MTSGIRVCSILLVWIRRLCSSGGRGLWLVNDKLLPADALNEVTAAVDNNDEDDDVATEVALVAVTDELQAIEVAIASTNQ